MRKLKLGLPVMLHSEPEIFAFLRAKERLEGYGDKIGIPLDVGAFLFFLPSSLKPESFEKQLVNQHKFKLPIFHAQASFQLSHNLAYSKNQEGLSDGVDLLDRVIDYTGELKKIDTEDSPTVVDFNVGAFLCRQLPKSKKPFMYNLEEFLTQKSNLLSRIRDRFSELESRAKEKGLETALENAITAVFVPHPHLKGHPPQMYLHPFNDIESMRKISGDKIVLDVAHWAATQYAPDLFETNNAIEDKEWLFKMEGISDWDHYKSRNPSIDSYTPFTKVFHLSNATGLGLYLEKDHPDLYAKWKDVGTIDGRLSKKDFRNIISHAKDHGKPVILEVDYDVKNIPSNNFKEADVFLRHIFSD